MGVRAEQQALRDRVVMEAAAELFLGRGYAGTTIPAIAERAGVAVGTVAKVGSKDALFLRVIEAHATEANLALIADLAAAPVAVSDKLWLFFSTALAGVAALPDPARDYLAAYVRTDDHTAHRDELEQTLEALSSLFGVADVGPESPARIAAQTLWCSSTGLTFALVAGTATPGEASSLLRFMVEAVCRPFETDRGKDVP